MEEKRKIDNDIYVDTEEIADYLYSNLIKRGYAPGPDELEELADIVFEYLVEKTIVDVEE